MNYKNVCEHFLLKRLVFYLTLKIVLSSKIPLKDDQ